MTSPVLRDRPKCGKQALWVFAREAEGLEAPRLVPVVRMRGVQKVVNDLVSLDDGEMGAANCPSLGATATDLACALAGLLGVGSQRLIRSCLPAWTGRSVSGGNVAVNAQTNQLPRGILLLRRTVVFSVNCARGRAGSPRAKAAYHEGRFTR